MRSVGSAGFPGDAVVAVAHPPGEVAAGVGAVLVAQDQGLEEVGGYEAGGAPVLEDGAVAGLEDAVEGGVAAQGGAGGGVEQPAGLEPGQRSGGVGEGVEVDDDVEGGRRRRLGGAVWWSR